jgi:hypothetical protein
MSNRCFAIYGIAIHWKKLAKIIPGFEPTKDEYGPGCVHEFDRKNMRFCPTCGSKTKVIIPGQEEPDYETVEEFLSPYGWVRYCDSPYGDIIGTNLEDNPTLKELQKTKVEIKKVFNEEAGFYYGEDDC